MNIKSLVQHGIFHLIYAVFLALIAILGAMLVVGMILQMLGNISLFPQFFSMIFFGQPLSILHGLFASAGIVLFFYAAYSLFETQTTKAAEVMLCILSLFVWLFWISLLLGGPLMIAIEAALGIDLPFWAATPLGIATLYSIAVFSEKG